MPLVPLARVGGADGVEPKSFPSVSKTLGAACVVGLADTTAGGWTVGLAGCGLGVGAGAVFDGVDTGRVAEVDGGLGKDVELGCLEGVDTKGCGVEGGALFIRSMMNTCWHDVHLPLRYSISGLPSNKALQNGQENANPSCDAGAFEDLPIVKMCLQFLHMPRVPCSDASQTRMCEHFGQGTSNMTSAALGGGVGLGMVKRVWQPGHSHFLPWEPSGTRSN